MLSRSLVCWSRISGNFSGKASTRSPHTMKKAKILIMIQIRTLVANNHTIDTSLNQMDIGSKLIHRTCHKMVTSHNISAYNILAQIVCCWDWLSFKISHLNHAQDINRKFLVSPSIANTMLRTKHGIGKKTSSLKDICSGIQHLWPHEYLSKS